jgi:hypothetical protein
LNLDDDDDDDKVDASSPDRRGGVPGERPLSPPSPSAPPSPFPHSTVTLLLRPGGSGGSGGGGGAPLCGKGRSFSAADLLFRRPRRPPR